jgi:hypothetical protein
MTKAIPEKGRVAIALPTVKRLLKSAITVRVAAEKASADLDWPVSERTVRLCIDRLRAGSKLDAKVAVDRVAPNTFKLA